MDKERVEEARSHIQVVLSELYGAQAIDKVRLESALDNLCYMFSMGIHVGDLCIDRKTHTRWI